MLTKWHNSLKYVCKLCCEKPILYNTHIKYIYQWPGKAVYSTQANWKKNLPVVTFLQNDIMLLLTHFVALSKWNILWVMLKVDSVLSKTVEHESGKKIFFFIGCFTFRSSSEMKCSVSDTKRWMHYRIWN